MRAPNDYCRQILMVLVALVIGANDQFAVGQDTRPPHRVLPIGEVLTDSRSEPLRSLNSYFPFTPPESIESWNQRADELRNRLQTSLGLSPMPKRTPLNAVIHGSADRGDYTIEKVYFESLPGFFVTGNLYRPKEFEGKIPGVLSPHGHYSNGRFHMASDAAVAAGIENGAEKFPANARSPLQARCAHLARMGCTVFHYDMIGYADSQQIAHEIAHRFSIQRQEMNAKNAWRLFSPRAEAHLQSVMGLQTWNSIRALDFLESLPEVDRSRLAVTGSSGGGTQTFMLCAIDPRPVVAFPAVMVSTAMQGGCTCENCCYLRVDTGNVEIAALFAPKPLGLTAADDWTKEMETKGFPELQRLYQLLGKPDNVHLTSRTQFGHNYNQVSREAMYRWFNEHLKLDGPVIERPIEILKPGELTVWNEDHPAPPGGESFEQQLLQNWAGDTRSQLANQSEPFGSERVALRHLIGIPDGNATDAVTASIETTDHGTVAFHRARIIDSQRNHAFVSFCVNDRVNPSTNCVLWLHKDGKKHLLDQRGNMTPKVKRLYEAGFSVMSLDLFMQGEFVADTQLPDANRKIENGREAAGYTYGYNNPLFVSRVRDVVNMVLNLDNIKTIVALDETAPVAIVASALLGDRIKRLAVNTDGFRFADAGLFDSNFFPGGAKYGDLPRYLSMSAPRRTLVFGELEPQEISEAFSRIGVKDYLKTVDTMLGAQEMTKTTVDWIVKNRK